MNYKKKYHLNFTHARKLFLFDITLLLSIIILILSTFFWFTYDPTITDQIYLSTDVSQERIASGDYITYKINYKNNSDVKIESTELNLLNSNGFVFDKIEPTETEYSSEKTIKLGTLKPQEEGLINISGWLFGEPDKQYHVNTTLDYRQEHRQNSETKTVRLIQTLRGSTLELTGAGPEKILSQGNIKIDLELFNSGKVDINEIIIPLNQNSEFILAQAESSKGVIENGIWKIEKLLPNEKQTISINYQNKISGTPDKSQLKITPEIEINGQIFKQSSYEQNFNVIYPKVNISAIWLNEKTEIQPGDVLDLEINANNSGGINLNDLVIELPISSSLIDTTRLTSLNYGTLKNGSFIINKNYNAKLSQLYPNKNLKINLKIPISYYPQGGTDILMTLTPTIKSSVKEIPNTQVQNSTVTEGIKIGTQLSLNSELRYYTNEGDQLGRGPIPPQAGKETKYWAMITIQNSTSKISDLKFSAQLPAYVKWTGRSSVSHGNIVSYNNQNNSVYWSLSSLNPYEKAGIYFELALTPSENQIGTSPILVKNIQISANDEYINKPIQKSSPNLDITIPNDSIGKNKGVIVK